MKFRVVFTLGLVSALLLGVGVSAQQFSFRAGEPANVQTRIRAAHQVREHVHIFRERAREIVRHVREHLGPALVFEQQDRDPCRDSGWNDDYYRACDVREYTMPVGPLTVDAGRNGGIRIEGWDRNEIRVQAVVTAHARAEADAKQLASEVQVQTGGGKVSATGPASRDREWWSVSYRINVPRRNDLDLEANNGGISITGVNGNIRFDTTNGGVQLTDVGGDVRGETTNGGLTVTLAGTRWDGAGLDVATSNGGVTLAIPDNYNADLTTRTSNGGFQSEVPMTIQGELSPRRGISTTLGSGGPPVSVRTTNGGVRIRRR
jgi:hypothetical protein